MAPFSLEFVSCDWFTLYVRIPITLNWHGTNRQLRELDNVLPVTL